MIQDEGIGRQCQRYAGAIDLMSAEYEAREHEFQDIISFIDSHYLEEAAKSAPEFIAKHYFKNKDSKGKHTEWLPHVDKLIMEMLVNRTPPLSIHAVLYPMARTLFHSVNIVKVLPSLNHMFLMSKTISAYLLGKAKAWRRLHTDETCRRQTSLVNVVVGFSTNDSDDLKTICLNGSIIAEDGSAEAQS